MPTNCLSAPQAADRSTAAPLWAVVGPTASGKSSLALQLAAHLGGEIVACDSVQVYRGFDIGSAKASLAEQSAVPHHLLDVVDFGTCFDAQMYCERAQAVLDDCLARRVPAILCGGAGLYLRALRYGLSPNISAQPDFRAARLADEHKAPGAIYSALKQCDPSSARAIGPYNLVRLLRALEISTVAQEPASAIRARHRAARRSRPMRLIQPVWPDAVLRRRIEVRSRRMLALGLIDEVAQLLRRGAPVDCRPMGAVGYREVCQYLAGKLKKADLQAAIQKSTWAYARRQRTWLRQEADVHPLWMQGEASDAQRALALLTSDAAPAECPSRSAASRDV